MQELTTMAQRVGALLKARRQTIAVAESSTGGLISAALLAIPGASAYFLGGGVIYTRHARRGLLAVGEAEMAGIVSASEPYARVLAQAAAARLGADWGLGETGAAGPTGNSHGDAPGHTCIAVAGPLEQAITVETGRSDREANMWEFTREALALLERTILASR
ncbi:MAG: CinA family protein [Candidatus Lambdaproteobacteria bacterium]|nr:CinA family protein [Candidatus Lambdaproteobacteria bacterium]